eukprot:1829383-Ditylum_brightwellii.AAC.1
MAGLSGGTKFMGKCSELSGYVYDTDPRNVDQYSPTTEELARYMGATCENGNLVAKAIQNGT